MQARYLVGKSIFFFALLAAVLGYAAAMAQTPPANAPERKHGLTLIGEAPALPPDFTHFPYANPDAPKGGSVKLWGFGSFDSVNPIPLRGQKAIGLGLVFDQLMVSSLDEPSTEYGLIAEWVSHPDDFSSVTFGLNPQARWHDGKPITVEDVIFSLETLKAHNPSFAAYYANVLSAEETGPREVTFHFDMKGNRELPLIVGQLTVFPKHFWASEGRDPARTTLDPVLGSGPYRIRSIDGGRSIIYERVPDYWAQDLPAARGHYNFDELRFDYYRDQTIAFEAFKAGKIDFFQESSARNWATGYDFPALKDGRVVKRDDIVLDNPQPMQAFVMNLRRAKFEDARVRLAFNLAFDFEWANETLFYGQYERTTSFFENTELAATGLPEGHEREVLEKLREEFPDHLPASVLSESYTNPTGGGPANMRPNYRRALALMREAGWEIRGGKLTNVETGQPFEVEFLLQSPAMERVVLPYIQSLARIGITARARVVDSPQYKERTDRFDFDIIVDVLPQSESPGNEQRDFWGSAAADIEGSRNTMGIRNPAVDRLIDMIIAAPDRQTLVAVTRALDRVLLHNHYVVPQWYTPTERIAYWNKFAYPEQLPKRTIGFIQIWWHSAESAIPQGQ